MSGRARPLSRVILGAAGLFFCGTAEALDVERLEPQDITRLESVLQRLDPLITAKKRDGTANLLTWEELRQPLSDEEWAFVAAFRALKAEDLGATSHYFGEAAGHAPLVPVGPQQIVKDGMPHALALRQAQGERPEQSRRTLDPQFLPQDALEAYRAMMDAMEQELDRRLLVESGYRSPAYQLYLFLFYLPKHDYSIRETNRYVALPGYSEHGNPARQAIDFINEAGINGEDNPEEFEALPEYQWLVRHAASFGFHLSYPRDNPHNTAFEPWHWHYEGR